MTDLAAMQGDYTDLKFIKSRKVAVISIEIPIEAATSFVAAFGTPSPATGVPVAIARIDPNGGQQRKGGKLAQKAGILCNEGAFQKFMGVNSAELAAANLRNVCGVASRADLDSDGEAARKFKDLEAEYKAWLTV